MLDLSRRWNGYKLAAGMTAVLLSACAQDQPRRLPDGGVLGRALRPAAEADSLAVDGQTPAAPAAGEILRTSFTAALTDSANQQARAWVKHTQGMPFVIGYEAGQAQAQSAGKPMLVFVTSQHCHWCEKLAEDCFRDPAVRVLMDRFVCVLVDGQREPDIARRLGARAYPHLVLQSADGAPLGQRTGYANPAQLGQDLEDALVKLGPSEP